MLSKATAGNSLKTICYWVKVLWYYTRLGCLLSIVILFNFSSFSRLNSGAATCNSNLSKLRMYVIWPVGRYQLRTSYLCYMRRGLSVISLSLSHSLPLYLSTFCARFTLRKRGYCALIKLGRPYPKWRTVIILVCKSVEPSWSTQAPPGIHWSVQKWQLLPSASCLSPHTQPAVKIIVYIILFF